MITPREILDFWFERIKDSDVIKNDNLVVRKWFIKNPSFDDEIRRRFKDILIKASEGQLVLWQESKEGKLALIILYDQFSRNMFRDSHQMYEFDHLALRLSQLLLESKEDKNYQFIERVFIYLPFEHAEDLKLQALSVKLYEQLIDEVKIKYPYNVAYFQYNLDYARRHYEIIKRFGRFPHRNKILQRNSTDVEKAFLQTQGSSF